MWIKENWVQNWIKDYINMAWWICKRLHSWKIILPTKNKFWKDSFRAIQMEDQWTTDLVIDWKWVTIWVEVKKDKEEYDKWLKLEQRFLWEWKPLPPPYVDKKWKIKQSNEREISQIKEKHKILKRWWNYILTYSLSDFLEKFKIYEK